jgi:photosystem II stability/assembly factor-like uncharacterized protein
MKALRSKLLWMTLTISAALLALAPVSDARQPGRALAGAAIPEGKIVDLQRVNARSGWIRTDHALLWTDDAGATWSDITPGQRPLADAHFLDGARGAVAWVGRDGAIEFASTADRGRTWRESRVHAPDLARDGLYAGADVFFSDGAHGWILARLSSGSNFSVGRLFRTTDGGRSWTALEGVPSAGRLVFADANRGFLAGGPDQNALYQTEDGGRSWTLLELVPSMSGARVFVDLPAFTSPRDGSVALTVHDGKSAELRVFRTADGGQTWSADAVIELPAGDGPEPVVAAFTSGRLAAIGGMGSLRLAGEQAATLRLEAGERVQSLSFTRDGQGWVLTASGTCERDGECRQTTRLLTTLSEAGGLRLEPRQTLTRTERSRDASGPVTPNGVAISSNRGFDKCEIGTVAQMQTWWNNSPFRDTNIYFGGIARGCSNAGLTSSWVSQVFTQGWRLIPTWVGHQAPCTGYSATVKMSSDAATARTQGVNNANSAVDAALALGLGAGTPLYVDIENYNETDTACRQAVRSYLDGWGSQVRARGYKSGAYATSYDIAADFNAIANPPEAVWIAQWMCANQADDACYSTYTPSVFGMDPPLSNSLWANNQRIHQYRGDHYETWGGVQFYIDSNISQGPVAAPDSTVSCPYASLQTRVQRDNTQPWAQSISITQGQTFTVGTFQNGSGQLTSCCTSITVTGPNGYSASPGNLGVINPPYAGTYTIRGACGSLAENATVVVNPAASCPYSSLQTRVQRDNTQPWAQSTSINLGQSFSVGTFQNGSGQLTSCCTTITVTGPNGYSASPANLSVVTPPYAGTYTVRGVCGSLAENATVSVSSGSTLIPLTNPGMENVTTSQYGYINGWGPNGAWAFHSQYPRANNGTLGTRFGYYSAGTSETFGQLLQTRFQANTTYTFKGWAQGGGDNTGVVPFEIGYASTDNVLSSFVLLDRVNYTVGADWALRNGVSYTTPASGGPVGRQIIVRLGNGSAGGQSDIWFDNFELRSSP